MRIQLDNNTVTVMTRDDLLQAAQYDNVQAVLRMIRAPEGGEDDDAYRRMFGGLLFDAPPWVHPQHAVTVQTRRGPLTSTAAGAYQILLGTWNELVERFGFEDFSPVNQDLAAVALIARRGALDDAIAGRVQDVLDKCRKEWASLPNAGYDQPEETVEQALALFVKYGGTVGTSQEA